MKVNKELQRYETIQWLKLSFDIYPRLVVDRTKVNSPVYFLTSCGNWSFACSKVRFLKSKGRFWRRKWRPAPPNRPRTRCRPAPCRTDSFVSAKMGFAVRMWAACVVVLAFAAPAAGFLAPFGGVVRPGSAPLLRSGNHVALRTATAPRPARCARLAAASGGRMSGLLAMQMASRDELVQFEDLKSDFEVCKCRRLLLVQIGQACAATHSGAFGQGASYTWCSCGRVKPPLP